MILPRSLSTIALLLVAGCASTPQLQQAIPSSWLQVETARRLGPVTLGTDGQVTTIGAERVKLADGDVAARENAVVRGGKELTPRYVAIDSLDVSEERGEVVFSAKRETNFDIGLVSTDGSQVNWVPEDAADEVDVQWAPRGNKVSFTVRGRTGDLVRTVHIPTAMQLSVDFPWARVTDLAWDKPAERYAVVVESVDASPRVEVMKYDGTARTTALPPQTKLPVSVEALGEGALLLRPESIRYGETFPLVIWNASGDRFAWNDAVAALLRSARVAVAVTGDSDARGIVEAARQVPWLDRKRVFIVEGRARLATTVADGALVIRGSDEVPAGTWRRRGDVIETPSGVVESVAAGFIADQLKGISSENVSHR